MFEKIIYLPRYQKRLVSLISDSIFLACAFFIAMSLRLERIYVPEGPEVLITLFITLLLSLLTFVKLGLYRAVIRYMSNHAMIAVIIGASVSTFVLKFVGYLLDAGIPRSLAVSYWCLTVVFIGGSRMMVRSMVHRGQVQQKEKVLIYGSGKSGLQLSSMLFHSKDVRPVGFVDDDHLKHGSVINGLPVYAPSMLDKVIRKHGVKSVLLALGHTPRSRRAEVLRFLEPFPVRVQTMPDIADVVSGKAKIEEIRDVEIEDLLGRDEVAADSRLLGHCITGKSVMVTGAGGSIGSELCRQIARLKPSCMVLFELSEFALYEIEQELTELISREKLSIELHALLGSVQHQHRLEVIMRSFNVETVYHAAAYKHVPMVEHNVIEGVRNNIFGTWFCAEAAIQAKVSTFVLISTDKAVRPTNVMGATKRFAELVLQGLSARQSVTRFCMVRFGNVLGSSGSVVPRFRKQIQAGGPVTVTHPEITRYFMTIPEAAQLVLQAGSMGEGGDVFLLDMGASVRIADFARKLIRLMGLEVRDEHNPEGDIEILYTGLRPGEKLYEELLIGDNPMPTTHPRIMRACEKSLAWQEVEALLDQLDKYSHLFDCEGVRKLLHEAPLGYAPADEISDLIWTQGLDNDKSCSRIPHSIVQLDDDQFYPEEALTSALQKFA